MIRLSLLARVTPFLFFLMINPAWITGCAEEEPEFSFGEPEVLSLIEDVNASRWEVDGYEVQFTLEQAARPEQMASRVTPISSAAACGSRSFVKGAEACIDTTSMQLKGRLNVYQMGEDREEVGEFELSGDVMVIGLDLTNAEFNFDFNEEIGAYISFRDGAFSLKALAIDTDALTISESPGVQL